MAELSTLDATKTAEGLASKTFTSVEVTQCYLDRIAQLNPRLNAYLTVSPETALSEAKAADERLAKGERGALLGVPIAVKDILMTLGIRTTAASKMLEHYQPSFDATAIKKLRAAGAVILGKTNLDEFAHGASTENSAYGTTKNPWDTTRVPGGSSGGSAAAVAADLCAAAIGTDTGGSIRHPAAFCGIVGLKPSYGRISRSGLLSMTSSTDVIGPMTKTVADAASLLFTMAGEDSLDQTTAPGTLSPEEFSAALSKKDLSGVTIGVPRSFINDGLLPGVAERFEASLEALKSIGATIVDIELPHAKYGIAAYYVITPSEISSNLARFDGIRYGHQSKTAKSLFDVYAQSRGEGLGPEVKRRIMLGTYALSAGYYDAYYKTAQKVRTVIVKELDAALTTCDLIATPTAPHVAFQIGKQSDDPLKMYLEDVFMSPASLAGLPAISVPMDFVASEDGVEMPTGLQLIGRRFDEAMVLGTAHLFEQHSDRIDRRPNLS
ncbi:Asp-tRNA(Asn)/Glu-tRNA(Gln) amidotransferase GatCAB subunit A [Candidatus Uhrbacteria bacterium CG10_big_fil_rev_8_21_14_0_10_48_11]|uniref:Glutamyl-tRNA(Gln) amidotransferase subunit A n=1 Tax=Candidatus Uhrbacteria bacterium CG10_big_fil_rev_8_21_14_0_10_48_11 TaxID=1975037 RepID=A0A2M8LFN3_9BACT|nr:MAG: Asp-tRNA(Asn)/Glu-tRNA(Gln) amidotransferase GatCAB subunit A [Candidatus Uhrbacteria bacterium CG10_big_fil_rev_8_21_14_0_10_48_11]